MPPRARITREMILEEAYQIARTEGVDKITARAVAERLGCSTQPVLNSLSIFANADAETVYTSLAGGIFLCVVSVLYALFLLRKREKKSV